MGNYPETLFGGEVTSKAKHPRDDKRPALLALVIMGHPNGQIGTQINVQDKVLLAAFRVFGTPSAMEPSTRNFSLVGVCDWAIASLKFFQWCGQISAT